MVIKILHFVLIMLFLSCQLFSQQKVTVKASEIKQLDSKNFKGIMGNFYSVVIEIENNTDSTLSFWLMTCSWEMNFIFNMNTLYLFNSGCDSNYPYVVSIEKNKKKSLNGIIRMIKKKKEDEKYKLGFILVKKNEVKNQSDFKRVLMRKGERSLDVIWSNYFVISK